MIEFIKIDRQALNQQIKKLKEERDALKKRLEEIDGSWRKKGLITNALYDIEAANKGMLKVKVDERFFFIEKVTAKRVYAKRDEPLGKSDFFGLDTELGQQLKQIWETCKND